MLEAIRTTMRSRRACAVTGSAMTSRSRRSNSRGPPGARINGSLSCYPKRYANSPARTPARGIRRPFLRRIGKSSPGGKGGLGETANAQIAASVRSPPSEAKQDRRPQRTYRRAAQFHIGIQGIQNLGRLFLQLSAEPAAEVLRAMT